jgi:hypothetical protein
MISIIDIRLPVVGVLCAIYRRRAIIPIKTGMQGFPNVSMVTLLGASSAVILILKGREIVESSSHSLIGL